MHFRLLNTILFLLLTTNSFASHAIEVESKNITYNSNVYDLGYHIGDVVPQTLYVRTPRSYHLDLTSLPTLGKGSANVELRKVDYQSKNDGSNTLHTIKLDWQVFRANQAVRHYYLRPLILVFKQKDKPDLSINVVPERVLLSPVIPSMMDETNLTPRMDISPLLRDTNLIKNNIVASVAGLILSLLYFSWRYDWLNIHLNRLKPFRNAYRRIKEIPKAKYVKNKSISDEETKLAMQYLRFACNQIAGCTITQERLPLLFTSNTWLKPMSKEIENFYVHSDRTFFSGESLHVDLQQLKTLAHQLMMLETP